LLLKGNSKFMLLLSLFNTYSFDLKEIAKDYRLIKSNKTFNDCIMI
jgi:hypothetical protein